jgi:hypothetical protein
VALSCACKDVFVSVSCIFRDDDISFVVAVSWRSRGLVVRESCPCLVCGVVFLWRCRSVFVGCSGIDNSLSLCIRCNGVGVVVAVSCRIHGCFLAVSWNFRGGFLALPCKFVLVLLRFRGLLFEVTLDCRGSVFAISLECRCNI